MHVCMRAIDLACVVAYVCVCVCVCVYVCVCAVVNLGGGGTGGTCPPFSGKKKLARGWRGTPASAAQHAC